MELDELALAARAGGPQAMDDLLAACHPLVMRICSRILPCHQDAEDACQEALLAVATKLHGFAGTGPFGAWLRAVATNSARATYRQLKRRAAETGTAELAVRPDPRTTSVIAGTRLDLLDALEELERRHPQWVEAVVLRDLGDLSYDEIALMLALPPGTVKSRVHDGRVRLRARLAAG